MGTGQVCCSVVCSDRWSEVVKGFDIHDCMWVKGYVCVWGGAAPEIACLNPYLDMTLLPAVHKLFQWMPRLFLFLLPTHRFFQQRFLEVRRVRSRYDDVIVFLKTFSDDSVLSALEVLHGQISWASLKAVILSCALRVHAQHVHPDLHSHVGIFKQLQSELWEWTESSSLLQLESIRAPS